MIQADSVHSTPPTNTSVDTTLETAADSTHALETGLAIQQRDRETALLTVARPRKEASAEIERLRAFLDACDPYVTTELEENGDELDASYLESGRQFGCTNEDDEDTVDNEPSLGSSGHGEGGPITYLVGYEMIYDCEGDEHDGREPDVEDEGAPSGDDEPSLGWTDEEAVWAELMPAPAAAAPTWRPNAPDPAVDRPLPAAMATVFVNPSPVAS